MRLRVAHGGAGGEAVAAEGPSVPPERNFPVTVVIVHGVCAVATVALVLLTALGVFDT